PLDDSEVQIVWKTSYSGFGEVLSKVGQLDQNPIFAGKEYDEDLELYYFNARWYDPSTGRFISEDPVKDAVNWYVYCDNNPLIRIDPTGLFDIVLDLGIALTVGGEGRRPD
ncbi:MAG: RHS repeat-associated core domain-containing protein, partial [Desulfovibrionales bacterium]|nr:RHS repeat-associated core domain-containing protein [Desulfovibrionales bacterium]